MLSGLTRYNRTLPPGTNGPFSVWTGPPEIGALTGAVVRLGREAGIPTPLNDFLYGCLLPMERAARQE